MYAVPISRLLFLIYMSSAIVDIVRILLMVPIYALVSLASYVWFVRTLIPSPSFLLPPPSASQFVSFYRTNPC
jgi:hypothetical protein